MVVTEQERSTVGQLCASLARKNLYEPPVGRDTMEDKQVRDILKEILMVTLAGKRLLGVPRRQQEKYYIRQITLKLQA